MEHNSLFDCNIVNADISVTISATIPSSKSSNTTNSKTYNSTTRKNYCTVDGCYKEGIYEIPGFSGKTEYYCSEHYKEMQCFLDIILGN